MSSSQLLKHSWFSKTLLLTVMALLLTFVPFAPVAVVGGVLLIIALPGAQLMRWLGLYQRRWDFRAITLSVALGMVTSPLLIYWSSLLFGFNRWLLLVIFSAYVIALAGWVGRSETTSIETETDNIADNSAVSWWLAAFLICFTALGVFLAYFELNTPQGYYPIQMEDWQKHYGVAFSLRYTGIPPTSMFFYGMFPNDKLVYYYFLHLGAAALDLLQQGNPFLHNTFVTMIILASLVFSSTLFLLARTIFLSQKAAVWTLAFATIIGGLDVIPIIHRSIQKYREHFPEGPLPAGVFIPREHIDNWVSALSLRLNTFFAHHIWVPQHLTGLTILCLGCYLYLAVPDRRKLLVIIPLLLFAILGHSTWIAVIVLACLFLFAFIQIISTARSQGFIAARTLFIGYAIIALIFLAVAAPFLLTLVGPQAPKSGIVFEIPKLDSWYVLRPLQAIFGPAIWARLLDLPIHFLVEMGTLLVAGVAGLILYGKTDSHKDKEGNSCLPAPVTLFPFWILLVVIGIGTVVFFASGRGWSSLGLVLNNDLGLRAIMPAQVVLALFAGFFLAQLPQINIGRIWRAIIIMALGLLICIGVLYTAWEFTAMGLAKYTEDPKLSPDVYQTLRTMPEVTYPQNKQFPVVQHRLHRDISRFQLSLAGRPVGFSTGEAVVFHGDVRSLALAHELSQQAFDNGLPIWSYQSFQNLGTDYIFVGPAEREAMRHPEKYEHTQYFEQVFSRAEFKIFQVKPPLYTHGQEQAAFDNGLINFEGYYVDTTPVYPGNELDNPNPAFVTAWRLNQPISKNYTVYIHLVDVAGDIVAQADHQLWAWDVRSEGPTSMWTPNLTHLDMIPIPDSALTAPGPLTIRLGLWLPDTGQHFTVETSTLEIDDGGRLVIGELGR